jgi:hypothetical protein
MEKCEVGRILKTCHQSPLKNRKNDFADRAHNA